MEYLTQRFSIFKKGQGRPPPFPSPPQLRSWVDTEFLLVSAIGTIFYEYQSFFAGSQLICKWCCSNILLLNYDIGKVDFYSKSHPYQVYLQKNWWKTRNHLKVTTSVSLAGSVLLYKYVVTILFFNGKYMKCQLFLVIKLWLVQLTTTQLFGIFYVNFRMLQKHIFKNREFSSYHFNSCQHLKGCLFSRTQFLMIFGRGKYYGDGWKRVGK